MNLRVRGSDIPEPVLTLISALTNSARLHFPRVKYDATGGVLRLPIERLLVPARGCLLALVRTRRRSWKESEVIIREIETCTITSTLNGDGEQDVTLLFGVGVQGSKIFLSSAEESEGVSCYSVDLQVKSVDIEIADKGESSMT